MFHLALICLLPVLVAENTPHNLLSPPPTSPDYASQVGIASASFHPNFNKGEAGRNANGPMASVSIDWTVNNDHLMGRKPFVAGLNEASNGFSSLQIKDQIHISEGNTGAILYLFQGTSTNGDKLQCWNGEFLSFDQDVLLDRLITINEFDGFEKPVDQFDDVQLTDVTPMEGHAARNTAAKFTRAFNNGSLNDTACLLSDNVQVFTSEGTDSGFDAVFNLFNRYSTPFPDLLAHDEIIVADGCWAAVETIIQGTRTGPFTAHNGTTIQPDNQVYRTRIMRWYKLDDQKKVEQIYEVNNRNDLIQNMFG